MTLRIHRHNPPSSFEVNEWEVTSVWVDILRLIGDCGEDTPAKIFGVEGDGGGVGSKVQFHMAGAVLRDMLDAGCILWENDRRLKLIVTAVGRDVLAYEWTIAESEGEGTSGRYTLEWGKDWDWAWNGTNGVGDHVIG